MNSSTTIDAPQTRVDETNDVPALTIAIPVFNGEAFIAETIASVVAQTFTDFELLVSDNCSTDNTVAIVKSLASNEPRLRLIEQGHNLGVARNLNLLLEQAAGSLFCWLSADDLLSPTFLDEAARLLDTEPSIGAAFPINDEIDEAGNRLRDFASVIASTEFDHPDPVVRLRSALFTPSVFALFAVVRTDLARSVGGHGLDIGGDRLYVSKLALAQPIAVIDQVLFHRRRHQATYSGNILGHSSQKKFFLGDDDSPLRNAPTLIRRVQDHWTAVREADLDQPQRRAAAVLVLVRLPCLLVRTSALSLAARVLKRLRIPIPNRRG